MRFLIYEDEELFQKVLQDKLNSISTKHEIPFEIFIAENENHLLSLNEVEGINVNIVDIEHKNGNLQGIAMAELLRQKHPECHIVFYTSHIEKTYEVLNTYVEPLAYIYKGDQNFGYILENAIDKIIQSQLQREADLVLEFKDVKGDKLFVNTNDIFYIITDEIRQKYIKLYLYDSVVSVKGLLRDYNSVTSEFVQVSKSCIINKTKIKTIKKDKNPKNKMIVTSRPGDISHCKCILTPKYKNNLL